MNYEIIKREKNGLGGETVVFKYNEQYYYADLALTFDHGLETMIFHSDKDGNVSDWDELYCDRSGMPVIGCIENFIKKN